MGRKKNKNIKSANEVVEYSPEQILELKKCMDDPIYFAKTYVKIQHPKRGAIPFKLYPYQERLMLAFLRNRYNIVLSARQTGKCYLGTTKVDIVNLSGNTIISKIKRWILCKLDPTTYSKLINK